MMLTKNTLFFVFDNRKHKTVNSFLVVKCVFSIFFKLILDSILFLNLSLIIFKFWATHNIYSKIGLRNFFNPKFQAL